MKKKELGDSKIQRSIKPVNHLNRQIPPEPHTAMYVWHKYWSRKTWNVVAEFIKNYTHEQGIVLDPFAGSGVVAIEAVRNNRRAIVCDLNPTASLITELTLRPVNVLTLQEGFERVRERVQKRIESLYQIRCVNCGKPVITACFVREGDKVTEVRYPMCPTCEHRCETGCRLRKDDEKLLEDIEKKRIKEWYPKNQLFYDDGTPFMKKEHYDSLDQLFTKRNLQAAAWLYEAIEKEKSPNVRKFLLGAFTSMIHLCTKMMPVGNPQPSNHYTYFSSPGWTQHSYWSASRFMEQNVWARFEGAVIGHQGLIKAKIESERELPNGIKITHDWKEVLEGKADVALITGDCLELMAKMPDGCIDYVFTDPPYDSSIQYGELSFLWNAWLKEDHHYTEKLITHEIIHNQRQKKNFDVYHSLLSNSFREIFRILHPGRWMTLTFHNPTFKVRNATVRAGVFAGFDYQKIHHQPLGQVSAKAMLQPFGSAQGDFYLRFEKPFDKQTRTMEEISDERFRRIVIETCKEVIAERAEPTPYTLLINHIDPKLAKLGFFGTLGTGLDVKKVLEDSLDNEFKLVKARLGGAEGKLWWFNDPVFIKRLVEIPLTERVEMSVFRLLNSRGRVTFTQVWDSICQEFPNSLTPDSTSIADALEKYARKVSKGYWLLKDEIVERLRAHPVVIAILAMVGKERGCKIWIGRNEQGSRAVDVKIEEIRLGDLVTTRPDNLEGVKNLSTVLDMDLLWIRDDKVVAAFEVESTTTMTSGLLRGSNLPMDIPKYMVLPEEREKDFQRKMESPLFSQHFNDEGWQLLYFDALRRAFAGSLEKTDIESLIGVKSPQKDKSKSKHSSQMTLGF